MPSDDGSNRARFATPPTNAPDKTAAPHVASALAAEVAALDTARSYVVQGRPELALRALQIYNQQFPRGFLAQEATALRIDALVQNGDRAAAASLARRFLRAHPGSPHAERFESIARPEDAP
jgi:outer membrane protein assembly factor BamD (BamD/ComL family)